MVEEIIAEESKKVFSITLNRPEKLNAINFAMMRQIKKILLEVEENEKIQLIVFKGTDCRAFSTGFDTQEILTLSPEKKSEFWEFNLQVSELALTSEKLYMSLIKGFAVAAGFAFCLFTDFRVAENNPNIYFALPEINLGIFPYSVISLTTYYFPPSVATGMIFVGDKLSLERANQLGFIHRIFPSDEFDKNVKKYIRSITSQNAKVQRMAKICYNYERSHILKQMRVEQDFTQACLEPETLSQKKMKEFKRKWS